MVSAFYTFLRFFVFYIAVILIDLYVFYGLRSAISKNKIKSRKYFSYIWWSINAAFLLVVLVAVLFMGKVHNPSKLFFPLMGAFILLLVPKLVFSVFLLAEDFWRVSKWVNKLVSGHIFKKDTSLFSNSRRMFVSRTGVVVAGIPFISILYGLIKGKYDFRIHYVDLEFSDLPEAFDGFTITQLSDIHSGSFDSFNDVVRGVEMANDLKSDLMLFTGDMVNNRTDEVYPWIDVFSKLQAPYGKYSVFGNHDYGDYYKWESETEKQKDHEALKKAHHDMGFRLMLNEHVFIEKEGERIALIGIENWGLPPFPQYGDLKKAMQGLDGTEFSILMSHDPSHWEAEVWNSKAPVHLTLSGHTHGMQFGVEIPGFKWSPVKYKYPRWAGLYRQGQQYLYVNRGFGFIGFPGRVGIWPEITKITLRKPKV